MRLRHALQSPGSRVRFASFAQMDFLQDLEIVAARPEGRATIGSVVSLYLEVIRNIEDELDKQARTRALHRMPPHLGLRLLMGEIASEQIANFRVYDVSIIEKIAIFAKSISIRPDTVQPSSTAERIESGLKQHSLKATEAASRAVQGAREGNDPRSQSEILEEAYRAWRLKGTILLLGLVDISGLKLSPSEEESLWKGVSSEQAEHILADAELIEGEGA